MMGGMNPGGPDVIVIQGTPPLLHHPYKVRLPSLEGADGG